MLNLMLQYPCFCKENSDIVFHNCMYTCALKCETNYLLAKQSMQICNPNYDTTKMHKLNITDNYPPITLSRAVKETNKIISDLIQTMTQ